MPSLRNRLYRNNGNGTFSDVTAAAGLDVQLTSWGGGNGSGSAAADFDGDGWPDLYLSVWLDRNRLFLNEGTGKFRDATTSDIADPGQNAGEAVGDIDNDGDMDIFLPSGGGGGTGAPYRSLMLMNLGGGQFLDITEAVGLGVLGADQTRGVNLVDIDNDSDLDLLIGEPGMLFVNDGSGLFTDGTSESGFGGGKGHLAIGDFDLDGFADVARNIAGYQARIYHNRGNENHWLWVELAGSRSNRSGIGARLIASAGATRQVREILGGWGSNQDELVAHFGLGSREKMDRLEIRWPSGQVDVLTALPADRKIRVFEGREEYHVVAPTTWEVLSDSVVAGRTVDIEAVVRPALFERGAEISRVTADLSGFGGAAEVPLMAVEDGVYRLEEILSVGEETGFRTLSVMIDQTTSLGNYWTRLSRQIAVLPAEDVVIFDEKLGDGWTAEGLELAAEETAAYQGSRAGRFRGELKSSGIWALTLRTEMPMNPFGYALRFALRFGEMGLPSKPALAVWMSGGRTIHFLERVDLASREWQVVEIPLAAFETTAAIDMIRFNGNIGGDFYLDDVRLGVARSSSSANTAVLEEKTVGLPEKSTLEQNYPNPFNSGTSIRFGLAATAEVELAVFNLAGQQVVTLVEGVREMGEYAVRWDGRDDEGRGLASGVYLYRL